MNRLPHWRLAATVLVLVVAIGVGAAASGLIERNPTTPATGSPAANLPSAEPSMPSTTPEPSESAPAPTAAATSAPSPPAPAASPLELMPNLPTLGIGLILRMEQSGGLGGPDWSLLQMPGFVLLEDGRVILSGVGGESTSALPYLPTRQLSREGVQRVLAEVGASGQLATSSDWPGTPNLYDASSFVLTVLNPDPVTVRVYGFNPFASEHLPPPPDEVAVRDALTVLAGRLVTLDDWLPADSWAAGSEWQQYVSDPVRLIARNVDADEPGPAVQPWPSEVKDGWVEFPDRDWGEFRCKIASGADATTWISAMLRTGEPAVFESADGRRWSIGLRFVLPDEDPRPACW